MGKWRRHSLEFRKQAVEKIKVSDNVTGLARELGIEQKLLYTWKYQFEGRPEKNHADYSGSPPPDTIETRLRGEIKDLKELLGEKAAEVDFFAAALRRVKKDGQAIGASGDPASAPRSRRRSQRRAD